MANVQTAPVTSSDEKRLAGGQLPKLFCSIIIAVFTTVVALMLAQPWAVSLTIGVTVLTAIWWVTELVPIAVASMLPVVLLPLFGVLDSKTAASVFGHPVVILLIGAFMMAKALEKSGVDKRLALSIIGVLGADKPKRILLGTMLTSAFLSMWMSNVATALMMLPIVLGISAGSDNKSFASALLLGLAFSANVGGIATPIGTPANVVFSSIYTSYFDVEYSFIDWMMVACPIVIIALPLMAMWLGRHLPEHINVTIPKAGHWQCAERRVLLVFAGVVVAWVFRTGPWGGWSALLPTINIDDSTIALIGVVLMFVIPAEKKHSNKMLLDWQAACSIPWSVIFLLAGGICLATGFKVSGLSDLLGAGFSKLAYLPIILTIIAICLLVTFLTEITSNTAITALLMPILASAAIAMDIDAKLLMIPAAMSASCAFMLPAATAPNAVVYGANAFSIKFMAKEGFAMNLLLAGLISLMCIVFLVVL